MEKGNVFAQRNPLGVSGVNLSGKLPSVSREESKETIGALSGGRPSSRPGSRRGPDELTFNSDFLGLGIFNPRSDERSLLATLKADALQLQDEINRIDVDKRLRAAATPTADLLKKSHIGSFRRFLTSQIDVKEAIEGRLSAANGEIGSVLEALGVASVEDGLRKLLRAVVLFDLVAGKLTELEILAFLKYDDVFQSVARGSTSGASQLAAMSGGVQVGRFNIVQANCERLCETIGIASKLARGDSTPKAAVKVNSLLELSDALSLLRIGGIDADCSKRLAVELNGLLSGTARESGGSTRRNLREEEAKYKDELNLTKTALESNIAEKRELQQRLATLTEEVTKLTEENARFADEAEKIADEAERRRRRGDEAPKEEGDTGAKQNHYAAIVDEIRHIFDERYSKMETSNIRLSTELHGMKTTMDELRGRNEYLEKELKAKERERDTIVEGFKTRGTAEDTFEALLKEEFARLQKAYDMRVKEFQEEISTVKRDRGRAIIDLQTQLQREKDSREIILKKLSLYVK